MAGSPKQPRRARDYAAEERRRNERARQLGFTTRAQQRRALRHGFQPPRKGTSPRGPIAYEQAQPLRVWEVDRYTAKAEAARERASSPGGAVVPISAGRIKRLRKESEEWSKAHSRIRTSRYRSGLSDAEVMAYHAAFVDPETRAWKIENGLDSLRAWLVDLMGFYTDDVFDIRYGIDVSSGHFPAHAKSK